MILCCLSPLSLPNLIYAPNTPLCLFVSGFLELNLIFSYVVAIWTELHWILWNGGCSHGWMPSTSLCGSTTSRFKRQLLERYPDGLCCPSTLCRRYGLGTFSYFRRQLLVGVKDIVNQRSWWQHLQTRARLELKFIAAPGEAMWSYSLVA